MSVSYRADWKIKASAHVTTVDGCHFWIECWKLANTRWTYEIVCASYHNRLPDPPGFGWVKAASVSANLGMMALCRKEHIGEFGIAVDGPDFPEMGDAMSEAQSMFERVQEGVILTGGVPFAHQLAGYRWFPFGIYTPEDII